MSGDENDTLSPEEWALVNAILYAEENPIQIRQIVQSYRWKQDADDKEIAQFLFALGKKLFTRDNCEKATRVFSACIIMDPESGDAYFKKAETQDWCGNYQAAQEILEAGAERFPNNSEMLKYLAELQEHHHNYESAAASYRKILENDPKDGQSYLKLLQLLSDHQLNPQIVSVANAIPIPPIDPKDLFRVLNMFVVAFEATKEYHKALAYADQALKYKPKRIALWEKKAIIFTALGRYEEALKCYEQMCLIKPQAKKYQEQRDKFAQKHKLM